MKFRPWLEQVESNRDFWEQFFLAAWRLSKNSGGLGVPLTGLDPKAISQTSAFQEKLSPNQQELIAIRLDQGRGTVGDLVNIAVNPQSEII